MSSSISSKAMQVPAFQAASGKGDGQGNGSGGMYFGQEPEQEQNFPAWSPSTSSWDSVDAGDIPYSRPLDHTPDKLYALKVALANGLYADVKSHPIGAEIN